MFDVIDLIRKARKATLKYNIKLKQSELHVLTL